jgi:TRAP-type C4-dicarboxylate transport system permease small subunit
MGKVLSLLELISVLVLCSLVTWVASQYVLQMYSLGAKSQTAQIPMWIPHIAIAAGFGLMVLFSFVRIFRKKT